MNTARLKLLLRVLRALCGTKTGRAFVGLYAMLGVGIWLVSHGYIKPDGSMDIRLWINGQILDLPKINAWMWGGGVSALLTGCGLYGRAVAKGPLAALVATVAPEVAAVAQALVEATPAEPAEEPRPDPVVLRPVAVGLGASVVASAEKGES